jgi:putative acetyltransferase
MLPPASVDDYWQAFRTARGIATERYTAFAFGDSPALADSLAALVLGGDKRATAGLAREYRGHGGDQPLPAIGDYAIVLDGAEQPRCIIRTTRVEIEPLSAVGPEFAWQEAEGDRSLDWWMDAHLDFFARQADAEGFAMTPDIPVVLERFELVWPACPAVVRAETAADIDAVRSVVTEAFATSELGHQGEADIVDAVRAAHASEILSIVAEADGQIVGHALFSPVTLGGLVGMGLGPMAVAPAFQSRRVGARVVTAGLAELRSRGCPFVVVLGHPGYYPRFGFRPASSYGVACELEGVPDEAFMVLALRPHETPLPRGTARFLPELVATA